MRDLFNTEYTAKSKDEWLTPPYIWQALGKFDLDPCEPVNPPWRIGDRGFTMHDNGLMQEWRGRVWLNPPYGNKTFTWLRRLSAHDAGGVALIFARTETKGFHAEVWAKAHSVFFFSGRIRFLNVHGKEGDGCANAPSCLVAYTPSDTDAVARSGLAGKLVILCQ